MNNEEQNILKNLSDEMDKEIENNFINTDERKPDLNSSLKEYNKIQENNKSESIFNDEPEHKQEEPKKATFEDAVNTIHDIKIDLSSINICEPTPMDQINDFQFVLNARGKNQIVASQSNYIAYMEALNYNEISALTNSNLDDFAITVLLAQTVHSKINTTSLGKLDFEKWCSITSSLDLPSFLYGIYLQTFPGTTKFTVKCGNCGKDTDVEVNNDTLITANDNESVKNVQYILNNKDNPKELLSKAIINNTVRIILPDSKYIVDLRIPTIKKKLDLLKSINKKYQDKTIHIISLLLYMDKLFAINVRRTMETGKASYYEIKEKEKKTQFIASLSFNDAKFLNDKIDELIKKYSITYSIKNVHCNNCQKNLGNIDVDMERLLFYQILQL